MPVIGGARNRSIIQVIRDILIGVGEENEEETSNCSKVKLENKQKYNHRDYSCLVDK